LRPQSILRARRLFKGLGVVGFATALPAAASAAWQPGSTSAPLVAKVVDRHLHFGQQAVVKGRLAGAGPGQPVTLEFRPNGGDWGVVTTVQTGEGGTFRFAVPIQWSGALRVVQGDGSVHASAAAAGTSVPAVVQTPAHAVAVAAAVRMTRTRTSVLAGRRALVSGVVRPGGAGRRVALQQRAGHGWRTVAHDWTNGAGRFRLRFHPGRPGSAVLRVKTAGEGGLSTGRVRAGRLNVFRRAVASWYGPGFYGGHLACGGTLTPGTLGVASKTLPCGTRVTFKYRGRIVRVPVIDRGPYVAGREYDLTAATKAALGFGSTGVVLATR
jgi:hypothetical protein